MRNLALFPDFEGGGKGLLGGVEERVVHLLANVDFELLV